MEGNGGAEVAVTVVKSEELWLQDGNIIVRTTSSSTAPPTQTLYKVHKHVLALHCSVFSSLFDGPQGAFDAGSEHEGDLPIMDLPDSADDVRDFLKALYFPGETNRHQTLQSPFRESDGHWALFPESYGGILRLATKYDASVIRKLIVEALEREWPTNIDDWKRLQERMDEKMLLFDWTLLPNLDSTPFWPDPVRAIRLASDYDVPNVLPIAYYDLMRVLNADYDSHSHEPTRDRAAAALTADELRRVIHGRTMLQTEFRSKLSVTPGRSEHCESGDACAIGVRSWMAARVMEMRDLEYDPLRWLEAVLAKWRDAGVSTPEIDACRSCRAVMQNYWGRAPYDLWGALPEYFGVDGIVRSDWGE
ncbi:hypothetical protein BV25DRAFT_1718052 [Artomyces pyxidatus]|uniref:Uncharacterized protein n=1 Tax=Artomyces pyxidatus TaxID=48021 RepID=A0ACB8SHF2_9AGAM|nr:hypothetical protein BV25DRAFT_1718052 [Artomyces pyxidatus]